MSLLRLTLILFVLVAGAVIALIGFDVLGATDAKLFGWCGLAFMAAATAFLLGREP